MKLHVPAALTITALLTVAAAAAVQPAANAAAIARTTLARTTLATKATSVHFATPLAAMRYFAAADDRDDVTALHHVTTPQAFKALMAMRSEAVDVRAKSCSATKRGDYYCALEYRYPKSSHEKGNGWWDVIVAPATNPGWYVYQFASCG